MKIVLKRAISLLLASMMLMSCMSGVVFAAEPDSLFSYVADKTEVDASNTPSECVTLSVTNDGKVPIAGATFYIYCDTEAFTVEAEDVYDDDWNVVRNASVAFDAKYGGSVMVGTIADAIAGGTYNGETGKDGYKIVWYRTSGQMGAETMANIYVYVNETAYNGTYDIELDAEKIVNSSEVTQNIEFAGDVQVTVTNGKEPEAIPAVNVTPAEYTYDGTEKQPAISVGSLVKDNDYTLAGDLVATKAGIYTIKATGIKHYTGESTADWTILPAVLTEVTVDSTLTVLNNDVAVALPEASAKTVDGTVVAVSYALKEGSEALLTLDSEKNTVTGKGTEGTAVVVVTFTAENHETVTREIAVTVQNKIDVSSALSLTTKATDVDEYEELGAGKTLDTFVNALDHSKVSTVGTAAVTYDVYKDGVLVAEDVTDLTAVNITAAGAYKVVATYEDTNNKGTSNEVTFTIAKSKIDVSGYTWNYSAAFEYNKAAHTVALSSFDSKLDITYGGTYTATDAGKYNATAVAAVKADYAANYEVTGTIAGCAWEITEKVVDLSDITYTASFVYDGEAKNVEYQNIPEGVSVAYTGDLDKVNVGEYTTTATFTALTNYKLSGSNQKGMHWSITKAEGKTLTAVWNPSYTDKSEKTLDFTTLLSDADVDLDNTSYTVSDVDSILKVTEIKNDEGKVTGITYALNNVTEANVEDEAVITVTFNSNNYAQSTYTVTVTVKEKQPIDESTLTVVESTTEVYIGAEFNAENLDLVTSSATPDGQWVETYVFTDEDGNKASYAKNVGKYSVEVTLEDESTTVTKTVFFEITPAELTVVGATVTEREYNAETTAEITAVSFTGLKGGDTLTLGTDYTVSDAAFADANAAEDKAVTFTVALTDAVKNYTLKSGSGEATGTIAPKTVTATVADIADQTYTGAQIKPEPVVTVEGALGEDIVGYTYVYGENVNVGSGSVTVEVDPSNYTFAAVEKIFKIVTASLSTENSEIDDTDVELDKSYDGTPITAGDIEDELDEEATVTFGEDDVVEGEWTVESIADEEGNNVTEITDAGSYTVEVTFESTDPNVEGEITVTITITVEQATPIVTVIPVEESDTTFAELVVTVTDAQGNEVPGTLTWYDAEGNEVAADDEVEANVEYTYVFVPTSDNYKTVTGTVTPYEAVTDVDTSVNVTPGSTSKGSVTVNPSNPEEGDKVVVTVETKEGYEVDEVIVTDEDGNPVKVVEAGDGKYVFVMPEGEVDIKVTYKKAETVKFVDVPENAWYHDAVYEAVDMGLFNGVSDKYFQPDGSMTRAMLVTVLWRLEGEPAAGSSDFADVADGAWYDEAVAWANAEGIVKGMSDTEFAPNMAITREQMATMLYRYAKYLGLNTAGKADLSVYTDADKVSEWAEEAMAWAVGKGLITGITETTLAPAATATRAQVATILVRFVKKFSL